LARSAEPPIPNSPGRWLTAFRHRARPTATGSPPSQPRTTAGRGAGRPVSPEHVARHVGCSGATVRRWEADLLAPDEEEIGRIAEICHLSPLQRAFLSLAFSHAHALPPPPAAHFREFMSPELSVPYPARVLDGLYYLRARNSFDNNPAAPQSVLEDDTHPIVTSIEALPSGDGRGPAIEALRTLVRIFWMETARLCHRPEYAALIARLSNYSEFCEIWQSLVIGEGHHEPVSQSRPVTFGNLRYTVLSRRIFFPPEYQVLIFVPDNDAARDLARAQQATGPELIFAPKLHWLDAPLSSRRPEHTVRRPAPGQKD
jgi:hypothetical protein